jgi:transcriptional regulator GlxA family with amidase domain
MVEINQTSLGIGFILIPNFALMSYAAAVEPLRAANLLAGQEIYRISNYAPAAGDVPSSVKSLVTAKPMAEARKDRLSLLFVCAGGEPAGWQHPAMGPALRELRVAGVRIGGISGGPYILAAAGLLENRRFTIHWEHRAALGETFRHLTPERRRLVIDRDCYTCGGGIAPLDMMYALISERMGDRFARRVSDWFLRTDVQPGQASQRSTPAERYGITHRVLLMVLEKMEATIETPLPREAMARFAGVSARHLQRLFESHMGSTFGAQYRQRRLEHATRLVRESPLNLSEVALATGYASSSHFSRSFKKQYGVSPHALRKRTWKASGF